MEAITTTATRSYYSNALDLKNPHSSVAEMLDVNRVVGLDFEVLNAALSVASGQPFESVEDEPMVQTMTALST